MPDRAKDCGEEPQVEAEEVRDGDATGDPGSDAILE